MTTPHRQAASFIAIVAALLLASCGRHDPPQLLRVGELLASAGEASILIAENLAVSDGQSVSVETEIEAGRFAAIVVRARGSATTASLGWKLSVDGRLKPHRRLDFPLLARDDTLRSYRLDLKREVYWSGLVVSLLFGAEGGDLEILEVRAMPAESPLRDTALGGLSAPSLPARDRIEIPLPTGLPSRARFESLVGVVPAYARPGSRVVFRASTEDGERVTPWGEIEVPSPPRPAPGADVSGEWHQLSADVQLPAGGTLVLEVDGLGPDSVEEGGAIWGSPLLLWETPRRELNLIVIVIDTLRHDVLGSYGSPDGLSPRLNAFAERATRFDRLFAPTPWTLPSVASLFSGLHPQTHGAGQRAEGYAPTGLTDHAQTLAEVLAEEGFYTTGIYNNVYLNTAFGMQQGFDRYAGYEEKAEFLVDRALEELAVNRHRRLFLFLHLFDPHTPYEPPERECEAVARRLVPDYRGELGCVADRPANLPLPSLRDRPWIEALYRAEVAYTDRHLGRFLDGLQELELDEHTVIAVLADHGEDFWRRLPQLEAYGYRNNADHGHTHYEELLRLPGFLYIPGGGGGVIRSAVEMVDLFPTLLGVLAVEAPSNQGRDLGPALSGSRMKTPLLLSDLLLYGRPRWSVQAGRWKLIVPHRGTEPVELFDLRNDPGETENVASARPEVVARLRDLGQTELDARLAARQLYLGEGETLTTTYLEWRHVNRLRALGYLN